MKSIKFSIVRERKPNDNVIVVRTQSVKSLNDTGRVVRIHCFSEKQLSIMRMKDGCMKAVINK